MPLRPNGPLITATRQVVIPNNPRGPAAITTWTTQDDAGNGIRISGRNTQNWGLYDTIDAVVTPVPATAAKAIYGLRESLILMTLCPVGMVRTDGYRDDADGIQAYGFATGGFGKPGGMIRPPRVVLILDSNVELTTDPTFLDPFQALYDSVLSPLGVEVYVTPAPCTFASMVPVLSAAPYQAATGIILDNSGDYGQIFNMTLNPFDPLLLQGGQVLVVAVGPFACGYQQSFINDGFADTYVICSQFTYGAGNPHEDVTPLPGGVEVAGEDQPISGADYGVFAMNALAAQEAAMLLPIIARCDRFAFDVIGLTQVYDPEGADHAMSLAGVAACDALLRNGIPGMASNHAKSDKAGLAAAIANRAVAFFS